MKNEKATKLTDKPKIHKASHQRWIIFKILIYRYVYYQHNINISFFNISNRQHQCIATPLITLKEEETLICLLHS